MKVSALTSVTPAAGDLVYLVDVSDTTDGPDGSSKKGTVQGILNLLGNLAALGYGPSLRVASSLVDAGGDITTLDTSGTVTVNLATSNRFIITPTGTVTFSLSNDADGKSFIIFIRGTANTINWWSGIKWTGGAAPTTPTTSGRVMMVAFTRLASGEYIGTASQEAY